MSEPLVIEPRFCGPADSGNGGYVGGLLASRLGGTVEASFRRPVPLGRELQLDREADGHLRLYDAGNLLVEAFPSSVTLRVPPPPTLAEAEEGAGRYLGRQVRLPFARCIGCGLDVEPGRGLRIGVGPTDRGDGVYAAPWTPNAPFAGADGRVRPEFVWTAVDCCAGFALMGPLLRLYLTARLAVDIRVLPRTGEQCIVAAWVVGRGERKNVCGSALFRANGDLLALARSLWIEARSA